MASCRECSSAQRKRRALSQGDREEKRPRGTTKEDLRVRRSASLETDSRLQKSSDDTKPDQIHSFRPPEESQGHPSSLPLQGQKRPLEVEPALNQIFTKHRLEHIRSLFATPKIEETFDQEVASGISASQKDHISHWAEEKNWPKEYFHQESMSHMLAARRATPLARRKQSEASFNTSVTPSDQRPREEKTAPYTSPGYKDLLEIQGKSFMEEHELGVTEKSKKLCQTLLEKEQPLPKDTIFGDEAFETACKKLLGKNEARVIKDLTPLIVPSAETLATLGAKHLDVVVESVNEGWNNCYPVTNPRPQPDYALGFGRRAFSDDRLEKLWPFVRDPTYSSYFKATYYMHFPFLTCEVKCGTAGLDTADRQNAHSMTVAMIGMVELFRLVKREQELHREILGFSISHDDKSIRIWGHYPVIDKDKTTYWRHSIREYYLRDRNGAEKWLAYNFTKNIYDIWVTPHFERICSAIEKLPLEEELLALQGSEPGPQQPELQQSELQISEASGLSQQFESQILGQPPGSQSSPMDLQPLTPDASTRTEPPASKKKKTI